MKNFEFTQDFTLLELTARQYKLSGLDNNKLAQEVLAYTSKRLSEDPNSGLSEDSRLDRSPGTEVFKLIELVDSIGALKNLKTKQAWGQIHQPLESTNTHHHGESPFAWVYYIKVPPGAGDLTFWFLEKFRYSIPPKESHLVLFPGWMNHSVSKNRGNEIRISLAGNFEEIISP
jgi:hypothetical protein